MPEWLQDTSRAALNGLPLQVAALRIGVAVLAGFVIAGVYRACVRKPPLEQQAFMTTLVLICALVAMTALVVDNSVARAFSLVGALAIVRFRTVVQDTRDTAFVIFAVVAGMSAGVGNWVLCAVGIPLIAVVALVRTRGAEKAASPGAGSAAGEESPLLVRIGTGGDPVADLEPVLRSRLADWRLVRTVTARQGAALELTFRVRMKPGGDAVALVREVNAAPGVQHVEFGQE